MAAVLLALSKERERWILWLPMAFGSGMELHFTLPLTCLLSLQLWRWARETKEPVLEAGPCLGAGHDVVRFRDRAIADLKA